jgi:glycosyltransferase involved in cell wall biosynthesis
MSSQPLVSIITPSFNQSKFLEETIQSVLGQDYDRVEYLLIDGASTDNSLDIIRKYTQRLSYWVSEPDRGQAQAINKGLKQAKGDILGWLNSDDVLLPGTIRRAVETLQAHPDVDVVYGRLERMDEQGKSVPTPILPKDRVEFNRGTMLEECTVNQAGAFWRREMMEKVGLLNESLRYVMDYEYWIRIAIAGGRFKRLPETTARFRLTRDSKTVGQALPMAQEGMQVIQSFSAQPGLDERLGLPAGALQRQARGGLAVAYLYEANAYLKQKNWGRAAHALIKAAQNRPAVFFDRRWMDLAVAKLKRRKMTSKE